MLLVRASQAKTRHLVGRVARPGSTVSAFEGPVSFPGDNVAVSVGSRRLLCVMAPGVLKRPVWVFWFRRSLPKARCLGVAANKYRGGSPFPKAVNLIGKSIHELFFFVVFFPFFSRSRFLSKTFPQKEFIEMGVKFLSHDRFLLCRIYWTVVLGRRAGGS